MTAVKIFLILLASVLATDMCMADLPDSSDEYRKWEASMLRSIEDQRDRPPEQSIPKLGTWVTQMSLPVNIESDTRPVFFAAQSVLLTVPGHAEYYDKRIRAAYADLRDPASPRYEGSANRVQGEMDLGFKVLSQLPSPETVKVLGDMLAEEWQHPIEPGDDYIPPALAVVSVHALAALPLREAPTPPFFEYRAKEKLPIWQKWYSGMKSGSTTFSFKGQNVEYRFKPDGTWETLALANPPDDAPKPAVVVRPEKPTPQHQKSKTSPPEGPPWPWLIGAAAAVLTGLVWLVLRKSQPRTK